MNGHASMNRTFRLIWSQVLNAWVAVSEITKGRGKSAARKLLATVLLSAGVVQAGPTGGQVVAGAGNIAQVGATTTITQSSQNLSLNWQGFNIAPAETVNFLQPSASAVAVNRIFDSNGSQILGRLNANGQVYLINPNGILFGQGAQVNVAGLVASTLDLGAAGNGTLSFAGNGMGSIANQGTINAAQGGYVAFIGNRVSNQGSVSAPLGTVGLGAGNAVTLTFAGNSLVRMQVDQGVLNSQAANGGLIQADGGSVILTAGAKDALLASVVNNSGIIEARTVNDQNGSITLLGGMTAGTVNVGGTLDASAPHGGKGGFIETSAASVRVADGAQVTTAAAMGLAGTWLIDPTNFTISSGAGAQTTSGMGASTLQTALGSGNVSITTDAAANGTDLGDINVNANVSWSTNKLTLTAAHDINVSAVMAASNAALDLEPSSGKVNMGLTAAGFTGRVDFFQADGTTPRSGTGFLTIGGHGYTVITSLGADYTSVTGTDLQGMNKDLAGYYALGTNIGASATAAWNASAGFKPIGTNASRSNITFNGLGHVISDLTIVNTSGTGSGLFGGLSATGSISNVGLEHVAIRSGSFSGGLVGSSYGSISNSYVTGNVSSNVSVGKSESFGGLVGSSGGSGSINNSYALVDVTGTTNNIWEWEIGGLVGGNAGTISNSYATGSVTSTSTNASGKNIGGLVGSNGGSIDNSHATGTVAVSGSSYVGGLAGQSSGVINNSYAIGAVTGTRFVGGLVGFSSSSSIIDSYAIGTVSGTGSEIGGLVGGRSYDTTATITNSFYDIDSANLNGAKEVTRGGLYGAQFADWLSTSGGKAAKSLNISAYLGTPVAGYYQIGSEQNLKDMLGFTDNQANSFRMNTDITLSTAGFHIPYFRSGQFDGNSHTISGLSINQPNGNELGMFGYVRDATINNLGIVGSVTGLENVGGLVGFATGATVSNSYATVVVSGGSNVGGLVGQADGAIGKSYASGAVTGNDSVGGLVGFENGLAISNSYAAGAVTGTREVGGLVGFAYGGSVSKSYASGAVIGTSAVGGLVGANYATTEASFYDKGKNPSLTGSGGQSDVAGRVYGMSTADMKLQDNFTTATTANGNVNPGWDFTTPVWKIIPAVNSGYPCLAWSAACVPATTTLYLDLIPGSSIYGDTPSFTYGFYTSPIYSAESAINTASPTGTPSWSGAPDGTRISGVRDYSLTYSSGITLGNTAYTLVAGSPATWTITQRPLTASITASSSMYGSTLSPGAVTFSNKLAGDVVTDTAAVNTSTLSAAGKVIAGTYTQTAGASLSGTDAGNYSFAGVSSGANYTVNPLAITGSIATGSSIYGATLTPGAASLSGVLSSDVVNTTAVSLNTTGNTSTAGKLKANSYTGIESVGSTLTGADSANYTFAGAVGNYTVSQLALSGSVASSSSTYGSTLSPGAVTFSNKLAGDVVTDTAAVNTSTLSAAGKVVAGTYTQTAGASLSGTDAGNYSFAGVSSGANYTVNQLALSGVSVAATGSVYGATVTPGAVSFGNVVGTDVVTATASITSPVNSSSGHLNAGSYTQRAASTLAGADAGNYSFGGTSTPTANYSVAPATLSYVGTPATAFTGTTPTGLTGTVNGFASGDTLANATTGTLAWNTPATMDSAPGSYAIDGSGLSAGNNYGVIQATTSAVALTLKPGIAPPRLQGPVTAVESTLSGRGNGVQVNTRMELQSALALQVVNGGIRLPDNLVIVSE